jgi:hypothetical protein
MNESQTSAPFFGSKITYTASPTTKMNCIVLKLIDFRTIEMFENTHNTVLLYRIGGSYSGDYEEFRLLEYNTMYSVESQLTFRRNMSPFSG